MQPTAFTSESILAITWQASWQAACVALLIWCLVRVLGQRIAARWRFVLWSLVFIRLALPLLPTSPTSAFQLVGFGTDKTAHDQGHTVASQPSSDHSNDETLPDGTMELNPSLVVMDSQRAVPTDASNQGAVSDWHRSFASWWMDSANWTSACVIVWLVGGYFLLMRRTYQCVRLIGKIRTWRPLTDERLCTLLANCSHRLGVTFPVRLLLTDEETGPAMTGIWRPTIVIPQTVLRDFSDQQLEMIFCHELAHIRRRDCFIQEILLTLRAVHWFNPVAWWVLQRMQIEREMACDELVLETNGESQRNSYGLTLLQIAQQSRVRIAAPGLLGTADTSSRLQRRLVLIRDFRPRSWKTTLIAIIAVLLVIAVGLTNPPAGHSTEDPQPNPASEVKESNGEPAIVEKPASTPNPANDLSFEIKGRCLDENDQPLAGVEVQLFSFDDYDRQPLQLGTLNTGVDGEYSFLKLKTPVNVDRKYPGYFVIARKPKFSSQASLIDERHVRVKQTTFDLQLSSQMGTLSGRVVNEKGEPVQGATVFQSPVEVPTAGYHLAVTDKDGRYSITDLEIWDKPRKLEMIGGGGFTFAGAYRFSVSHPDYPVARPQYTAIPQQVDVQLQPGLKIEGRVIVKGQPVTGAIVTTEGVNTSSSGRAATDKDGKYRFLLVKDRYNITATAPGQIAAAIEGFEGTVGQTSQAPDIKLVEGGFIAGTVFDQDSGKPISKYFKEIPLTVAHYGPAFPKSGNGGGIVDVASDGTYRLHVAPGENYPFMPHPDIAAERDKNNALKSTPLVVANGETVTLDFHIRLPEVLRGRNAAKPQAAVVEKSPTVANATAPAEPLEVIKGRCLNDVGDPIAGARVTLFRVDHYREPPSKKWDTVSNATGEYRFEKFEPLVDTAGSSFPYYVVAARLERGSASIIEISTRTPPTELEHRLTSQVATVSGRVTDEHNRPIAGTEIYFAHASAPLAGINHAVTDQDGRYAISDLRPYKNRSYNKAWIKHRDYPLISAEVSEIPKELNIVLRPGITVEGRVVDGRNGLAVGGAEVWASGRIDDGDLARAVTDQAGRYRFVLNEDVYNIRAIFQDRASAALNSFSGPVGKMTLAPDLKLVGRGFIVGKILDGKTGQPVSRTKNNWLLEVMNRGPAYPRSGRGSEVTRVNPDGTYRLRVVPGENYPFISQGDYQAERTFANLNKVNPLIVGEGETITFDFHVSAATETPVPVAERPALPRTAVGLVGQLDDMRSQPYSEEWSAVLQALILLGPDAVPELIVMLDAAYDEYKIRCLAFVLRGIGDKRAVPALIRALPKTCVPGRSSLGLTTKDPQLLAFLQKHDKDDGDKLTKYYSFGVGSSEVSSALRKLTGSTHGEDEIAGIALRGSAQQQLLQRGLYQRCAERWAGWWEQHWREHVTDERYAKVNLAPLVTETALQKGFLPSTRYELGGGASGAILESVRNPRAKQVFHDLDTGRYSSLPAHLKVAEGQSERLDDILAWAAQEGFDLMGTEYTPAGSDQPHYVLRGLGLATWQIELERYSSLRVELNNKQPLKTGTRADGLLAQFDVGQGHYVAEKTAAFQFQTREGGYGAIFVGVEVHDDSLKPGTKYKGDHNLNPVAFVKGRRYGYYMFAEVGPGDQSPPAREP